MSDSIQIADVQSSLDSRNMHIRRVGIKDILHPVEVSMRDGSTQSVAAKFSLYSSLAADLKGTHMSRFVTLLNEKPWRLSTVTVGEMAQRITDLLESESSYLKAEFPLFVLKQAPVSKKSGWMDYSVELSASVVQGKLERRLLVNVPVKSLCPCSKKISDYGAHNQRSKITISVEVREGVELAIEQLIDAAEEIASCQLYSVLKRPDEKFVTERAYENPKFVEDMVRDLATELQKIESVHSFEIEAENLESIHNHSAYASISSADLAASAKTAASDSANGSGQRTAVSSAPPLASNG